MIVYHFTSAARWAAIQHDGLIQAGESNVHPRQPAIGGRVVHLTTDSTGEHLGLYAPEWMQQLSDFNLMDRTRIRITLELKKVPRFSDYCRRHNAPRTWVRELNDKFSIGRWRVHVGDIPREHWLAVHDMQTARPLSLVAPTIEPDQQSQTQLTDEAVAFLNRTKGAEVKR